MTNCSGLPDRTTLRHDQHVAASLHEVQLFRSSRPDYIETRVMSVIRFEIRPILFRSSRPEYIETASAGRLDPPSAQIVPVFQTGLH